MLTVLFWNVMGAERRTWPARKAALAERLAGLSARHAVDLLVLAECGFGEQELTAHLKAVDAAFHLPASRSVGVKIWSRLPGAAVADQFNDTAAGELTIRRLVPHAGQELLLAAVHMRSKSRLSAADQALFATDLAAKVRRAEDERGHRRTVVVGDLNMDPFDPGAVAAQALNAFMDRRIVADGVRTVGGQACPMLYNPMWSLLGDRRDGPPGSYYFSDSRPIAYRWHTFDQVLLRPRLMDALAEVAILDRDGDHPLVTTSGRPDKVRLSDHLPLLFRLESRGQGDDGSR